ncbi:hypothetical protein [Corynebacterium timonense]|uniref:hypothetical protein n=1 Tax=Corynebacterium timonense TaxID=441500 RepID=UPI0012DE9BD0|nr:hypothetical protein [Corynebacterium timonense]
MVGQIVSLAALCTRFIQFPPSWVVGLEGVSTCQEFEDRDQQMNGYERAKGASFCLLLRDLKRRRLSSFTVLTFWYTDCLLSNAVYGFNPFYQHLYFLTGCYSFAALHSDRTSRYLQFVPASIYSASGLSKLRDSRDWLTRGHILRNAVDLYGESTNYARFIKRYASILSRLCLLFEVFALPLAWSGRLGLKGVSTAGLVFHLVNWKVFGISFWHLGLFNLIPLISVPE